MIILKVYNDYSSDNNSDKKMTVKSYDNFWNIYVCIMSIYYNINNSCRCFLHPHHRHVVAVIVFIAVAVIHVFVSRNLQASAF